MPMRASRLGTYFPPKYTIRLGSASAFMSHLRERVLEQFPSPRQGALVELHPVGIFDQAAQCIIDACLRQHARNLQQRAEHHHVGSALVAELVSQFSERKSEHLHPIADAIGGKLLAVVDHPTASTHAFCRVWEGGS